MIAQEETHTLPVQTRQARFLPNTYNADARTIEVVWSTGAKVRRFDWLRERQYDEELSMEPSAIDMTRLNSGAAPVLDSHDRWELKSQIGVVDRAWIADGEGRALLRLSSRASVADIVSDIVGGIIRNISVGYSVQRMEIHETPGEVPIYRATAWQPHELSFVTIPADAGAQSRSAEHTTQGFPCVFSRAAPAAPITPEVTMTTTAAETTRAAEEAAAVPTTQDAPVATAAPPAPATAEHVDHAARAAEIVDLATRHGFADTAAEWIRKGHSTDHVRGLILDSLATRDAAAGGNLNRVQAGADESDKTRAAVENLLLARGNVIDVKTRTRVQLDGANPFRSFTLLELARHSLERVGVRTAGMSKLDLVGRAFTQSTSDFPVLLENAMHKSLQSAYAIAPDTWSRFCAVGSVSDFRAHNRYRAGSIGNLDAINELGEFQNKAIPDGEKASITASTKGNVINLSRQAIINDDLGAFIGLAQTLGRAAKRTVEADVYAFLQAVGTKAPDGANLFQNGSGHTNWQTSAAAVTVSTIQGAAALLAAQKDVSGHDFLDLRPAIWVGPTGLGGDARVVNAAEYDPDTANKLHKPNAVRGLFRDVVDSPRVTAGTWYLFADPSECPVIEVAFLDGQQEPFLDYEEGFSVDGVRWKVRLDYGIACVDFRGAVKNSAS